MDAESEFPMPQNVGVSRDERSVGSRVDLFARALIRDTHGRFLLAKATHMPDGRWEMPGGRVQEGQSCTMSIIHSLREGLGILTWPVAVVFIYDRCCTKSEPHRLSITYSVSVLSGELQVNSLGRYGEARWFRPDEVPQFATEEAIGVVGSRQIAGIFAS